MTVTSGAKRYVDAGEVFLVEDTKGKGHASRHVENKERLSLFITLEDDENFT